MSRYVGQARPFWERTVEYKFHLEKVIKRDNILMAIGQIRVSKVRSHSGPTSISKIMHIDYGPRCRWDVDAL